MRITIPRWAQLIVIPLAIVFALYFSRAASHAVFIFLMSIIIALLLNPLALMLRRIKFPRMLSVPLVYIAFFAGVALIIIYLGPPLVRQLQRLLDVASTDWLDALNNNLGSLETWLDGHGIHASLQFNASDIADWLQSHGAESLGAIISFGRSVAGAVINLFLVIVVSFYMLIDGKRIFRFLCRVAPGDETTARNYVLGLQKAFSRYVRGQFLLSFVVAFFSGLAIWVLSWKSVGVWPEGGQWALLFGVWAGVTEVIPYVGPFLGAAPAVIAALFHSPWAALIVAIAYLVVQQVEGHVLAPNIMGSSVGVHPLIVIFALLAGAQIGGILGMIAALPIIAMARHTFTFYEFRLSKAAWAGDDGAVVPVVVRDPGKQKIEPVIPEPEPPKEGGGDATPTRRSSGRPKKKSRASKGSGGS